MGSRAGAKCCNAECPYKLQSQCQRYQSSANMAVKFTPFRNKSGRYWCDGFDKKESLR